MVEEGSLGGGAASEASKHHGKWRKEASIIDHRRRLNLSHYRTHTLDQTIYFPNHRIHEETMMLKPSSYFVMTSALMAVVVVIGMSNPQDAHGVVAAFAPAISPRKTARSRHIPFAKKKKSAGGGGGGTKVQVKLLKHIAGTGQAGDVIQVTPAFFNNKLRPTKSAVVISDEEVAAEQAENQAQQEEARAQATAIQEMLQETTLTIRRKAGPDGQLFGGVGPKVVVSELQQLLGDEKGAFLDSKGVKLKELTSGEGKKMRGDIKHIGDFGGKIQLTKDISAKFKISVVEGE